MLADNKTLLIRPQQDPVCPIIERSIRLAVDGQWDGGVPIEVNGCRTGQNVNFIIQGDEPRVEVAKVRLVVAMFGKMSSHDHDAHLILDGKFGGMLLTCDINNVGSVAYTAARPLMLEQDTYSRMIEWLLAQPKVYAGPKIAHQLSRFGAKCIKTVTDNDAWKQARNKLVLKF